MFNIAFSPDQLVGLVKDAEYTGGRFFVSPDEDAVKAGQPRAWWEQVEVTKVLVEDDPKGDDFPNNQRVKVTLGFRVADEGQWLDHQMSVLGQSENAGRSQDETFYLTPTSEHENLNKMTDISSGKLGQVAFAGLNLNPEDPSSLPVDAEGKVDLLSLVQQAQGTFMWARFRRYRDDYVKAGETEATEAYRTEFSQATPVEVEG